MKVKTLIHQSLYADHFQMHQTLHIVGIRDVAITTQFVNVAVFM